MQILFVYIYNEINRVLKWWRHKNEISENYGICQDILKEQCPRGLLAKNEHFAANCLWDRSPVKLRKLHTNPSNLVLGRPQKNLEFFFVIFIIVFLFLVSPFYFYFYFLMPDPPPVTRYPPPVHPPPVTRHPSPVTRGKVLPLPQ